MVQQSKAEVQFTQGSYTYRFNAALHRQMVETADEEVLSNLDPRLFDPDHCESIDGSVRINEGRGQAVAFPLGSKSLILKHYRRGGLIQRISQDSYIWTGLSRTRAWREFDLLILMRQLELPVPQAYACRVEKHGPCYRARMLVELIGNNGSMLQRVREGHAAEIDWVETGRAIGTFGRHCIFHADLNASNILVDATNQLYLIDFDRGRCMKGGKETLYRHHYENRMVQRLRHSLEKFPLGFTSSMWRDFLSGYSQTSPQAIISRT